jgi:hypothetical protein
LISRKTLHSFAILIPAAVLADRSDFPFPSASPSPNPGPLPRESHQRGSTARQSRHRSHQHPSRVSLAMVWVDHATPEIDAQSEWRTIVAICSVLSAFSLAIVSARLWIRHKNHGLAADDWMSILSMVFALIYSTLCIVRMFTRPRPPLRAPPNQLSHPNCSADMQKQSMAWGCRSRTGQRKASSRTRTPTLPDDRYIRWVSAFSRLRC